MDVQDTVEFKTKSYILSFKIKFKCKELGWFMTYLRREQEIKHQTLDYTPVLLPSASLPRGAEDSAADSSWCCRSRRPGGALEHPSARIVCETEALVLGEWSVHSVPLAVPH